jgi:DNA-binding transcriptional LysR family regulator
MRPSGAQGPTIVSHVDISNTYLMELRDLRALLAVVRYGSFTVAADELGYTQSAVSQQVASLEAELGQRLVERRPVRPTPAGRRLAEHAAHVLLRVEVAQSEVARLGAQRGEVKVATTPLASPHLLAKCLRSLRAETPELRISLKGLRPGDAVNAAASGAVDVALVDGIAGPNEPLHTADAGLLASTGLAEAPMVVVMPRDHPLRENRELALDTLADAPWVFAPSLIDQRPPLRRYVVDWREAVRYEGADLATLFELVGAGLGVALLPQWACSGATPVSAVPITRPPLVHRTELLTLRTADRTVGLAGALLAARMPGPLL